MKELFKVISQSVVGSDCEITLKGSFILFVI